MLRSLILASTLPAVSIVVSTVPDRYSQILKWKGQFQLLVNLC